MAKHILNKARDTTWTINRTGDTWILGEKGRITVDDFRGIYAPTTIYAANVSVDGVIEVEGGNIGVYVRSARSNISVSEGARITADEALYYHNFAGAVKIDNDGVLRGESGIQTHAAQNGAQIRNDGRILAVVIGIYNEGAGARIINSGIIKSDYGIDVRSGAGDKDPLAAENAIHVVNTGKITGSDYSIYAWNVAVNIRNKGLLTGDVYNTHGNDVVNNRGGTINGDIWGGAGNDVFNMVGGKLSGVLYGGAGDDVVTLSSPATVYVEYSGQGDDDTVRINGSYQLGANIEKLVLLGKGNHTGIGNNAYNSLIGNRGDNVLYGQGGHDDLYGGSGNDRLDGGDGGDSLYGGTGRDILSSGEDNDWLDGGSGNDTLTDGGGYDIFAFKAGNGRDTITDFENGTDYIELEYYGFGAYSEVLALMEDVDGDVVITFSNADQLIIQNATIAGLDPAFFEL